MVDPSLSGSSGRAPAPAPPRRSGTASFVRLVLVLFAVLAVGIVLVAVLGGSVGDMLDFDYAGF